MAEKGMLVNTLRQAEAGGYIFWLGLGLDQVDRYEQMLTVSGSRHIGVGPALPKILSMFHEARKASLPDMTYTIETALSLNPDGDTVLLIGAQERTGRSGQETLSAYDVATLAARGLAGYLASLPYTEIEFRQIDVPKVGGGE